VNQFLTDKQCLPWSHVCTFTAAARAQSHTWYGRARCTGRRSCKSCFNVTHHRTNGRNTPNITDTTESVKYFSSLAPGSCFISDDGILSLLHWRSWARQLAGRKKKAFRPTSLQTRIHHGWRPSPSISCCTNASGKGGEVKRNESSYCASRRLG